jgi:hypothetical protein
MTNPFHVIRSGDSYIVRITENGEFVEDVPCKDENEAKALANMRPFCEAYLTLHHVDLQELKNSIAALERLGRQHLTAYGLLCHLRDDIDGGNTG